MTPYVRQYLALVVFGLCSFKNTNATILASGNGGSTTTFNRPVDAKLFDRATGTLYIGLDQGTDAYVISKIPRVLNSSSQPLAIPIGSNTLFSGTSIQALARAALPTSTTPNIAGITTTSGFGTNVFVMTNDGTTAVVQSAPVLDASGAVGTNGATTSGIVALAANNNFIFTAVAPNVGDFGAANSGLAVVSISRSANSAGTIIPTALTQTAAVVGDTGIKAITMDPSSPAFRINNDPTLSNGANLFWDTKLQRLYCSVGLAITSISTGDGVRSVAVAEISDNGVATLRAIAPDAAFNIDDTTQIIGVKTTATPYSLVAPLIRVLHASTGPSYLIVNGGNADANNFNNSIFALPVVDDETNPTAHGTLADKNQNLTNGKFTAPAQLPQQLVNSNDPATIVGTFQLPTDPADRQISDMVVLDDAVYVSSNLITSTLNESGIFVSHAMFDEQGRISRWTPWQRCFPFNSTTTNSNDVSAVRFFDVDATTGSMWAIGGTQRGSIVSSRFDRGLNSPLSLPAVLQTALADGAYSILELDYYTRGFNNTTPNTYALFGGVNKVLFARTSQSLITTTGYAPHQIMSDFTNPQNFLSTFLPSNSGCVSVLEYSRTTTTQGATAMCTNNDLNFFFAGTGTGLYVFAQADGSGFNPADLSLLDQTPFTSGVWTKAPNIFGSVLDIASLGNSLYILVSQTSKQKPFKTILYRVAFDCAVSVMFDPTAKIFTLAETGMGTFVDTLSFTGIELIATGTNTDTVEKEQLILTTNKGLYRTNASQASPLRGSADATSDATAQWVLVSSDPLYTGIQSVSSPTPTTVWPLRLQDTINASYVFNRSSIQQCSGRGEEMPMTQALFDCHPAMFNSNEDTSSLPVVLNMLSDGGRRFFIAQNKTANSCSMSSNQLLLWPYNITEWLLNNPNSAFLTSPGLTTVPYFTWIQLLGSMGIVMAGTQSGVVVLQ